LNCKKKIKHEDSRRRRFLWQRQIGQDGEVVRGEGIARFHIQDEVVVDAPLRAYQNAVEALKADAVQMEGALSGRPAARSALSIRPAAGEEAAAVYAQ
jgi:hypothetical protein